MVRFSRVWLAGALLLSFITGSSLGTGRSQSPSAAFTADSVGAAITQYCVECHNDRLKTAGLALDTLAINSIAEHPEIWEKVVRKLRARMMPPLGRPRPDDNTYTAVVTFLEGRLDAAASSNPIARRTATFRRLNRGEYPHASRDPTAVDVR